MKFEFGIKQEVTVKANTLKEAYNKLMQHYPKDIIVDYVRIKQDIHWVMDYCDECGLPILESNEEDKDFFEIDDTLLCKKCYEEQED